MSRVLAVIAACLVLLRAPRMRDAIDQNVRELGGGGYKVRLAAALALAKSKDARAVIALADALDARYRRDDPARVGARAREDGRRAHRRRRARSSRSTALERAAKQDRDDKVKASAQNAMRALSGLRRGKARAAAASSRPEVFVDIEASDQSKKAPADAPARLAKVVEGADRAHRLRDELAGRPADAERADVEPLARVHRRVDGEEGRGHEDRAQTRRSRAP